MLPEGADNELSATGQEGGGGGHGSGSGCGNIKLNAFNINLVRQNCFYFRICSNKYKLYHRKSDTVHGFRVETAIEVRNGLKFARDPSTSCWVSF